MTDLLPDYLGERKKADKAKSIEQQRFEMRSWFAMYKRKEAEAKGLKHGS
jgi:hypothetical protein